MGEFASKGVAGSGLGLGIAGTALGVLNASANGGGLLGGLFGNGMGNYAQGAAQAMFAEKDAKIARLESEKYADHVGIDVYKQSRTDNTDLRDRIMGEWLKPLAQEAAATRERLVGLEAKVDGNKALQDKENELLRKEIEISKLKLDNKIDMVAVSTKNGIDCIGSAVASLRATVDGFMCHGIRKDSICPPVMERYNQWEAPTAAAPNVQPISGTVNVV